jgi:hypothetical protein
MHMPWQIPVRCTVTANAVNCLSPLGIRLVTRAGTQAFIVRSASMTSLMPAVGRAYTVRATSCSGGCDYRVGNVIVIAPARTFDATLIALALIVHRLRTCRATRTTGEQRFGITAYSLLNAPVSERRCCSSPIEARAQCRGAPLIES